MLHFPDPVEAISIAVKIQKSLAEQPIDAGGKPLAIRIGMDLGNPRPMHHPSGRADFSGKTLDQAARIEGLADGGQILISDGAICWRRPRCATSSFTIGDCGC